MPATPAPKKAAAPKAAHLKLNVPKTNAQSTKAPTEAHADKAPGNQNGTLAGKGATGGTTGTGAGGNGKGTTPGNAAPLASCPQPNRKPGVDETVEPEQPEGTEGVTGTVRVEVALSASGQVLGAKVGQSSGNALLDQAAVTAARRAKFHSERVNCVDVAGSYFYRVDFTGS